MFILHRWKDDSDGANKFMLLVHKGCHKWQWLELPEQYSINSKVYRNVASAIEEVSEQGIVYEVPDLDSLVKLIKEKKPYGKPTYD